MASFNGINEGGLNSILVRRLNVQEGSPAPAVAPELFPQLALEVDRAEWGWLKAENRFATTASVGAVAAELSRIRLTNPTPSQTLVVIERIDILAAQVVRVQRLGNPPALPTPNQHAALDTRLPNVTLPSRCNVTTGSAVGSPPDAVPFASAPPALLTSLLQPVVLAPGGSIEVVGTVVNTVLDLVNIWWRERRANPGELV